ncbi:MAG: prevent-host-death protein [Candidatus Omnitrophota bacterium]|jgi:hypothetical protein|nr:MAG: prevent-host-death protein [Candidatus Omnitrophota bacterium]
MKEYTFPEAQQRLSDLLNIARTEELIIKRSGGESFSIIYRNSAKSPFDLQGINTNSMIP